MINKGNILKNPLIPAVFYFAKVLEVKTEEVGKKRPVICIKLRIGPFYDNDAYGAILTCIIHPVDGADKYHLGFIASFGLFATPHDYKQAVGQWANIGVYDSEYQGTKYSAVRFYPPTTDIQKQVDKVAARDDEGEVSW